MLLEMDPSQFTPSQVYEGDPINSRLVLIIVFCVGIPLTWTFSQIGLFMYFKEWTCKVQFTVINQVQQVDFLFVRVRCLKQFSFL